MMSLLNAMLSLKLILSLFLVALVDYATGFELQFSIFYLLPIGFSVWHQGWKSASVFTLLAVLFSLLGDIASGIEFSSQFVPWWNVVIATGFYFTVVVVLHRLKLAQENLEARVVDRTASLQVEVRKREELEHALIDASEREQRRIGHDLHDSLCQHLTGAALAAQVLHGKIEAGIKPETKDSEQVVRLVEEGIDLSRSLARGLAPVELDSQGIAAALRALAERTTANTPFHCELHLPQLVLLNDTQVTTHLFRIAQEAVRNAVKHSRGRSILITLMQDSARTTMIIEDDGEGLPAGLASATGMGLHIMRHRASLISAEFLIERLPQGTRITVRTAAAATHESHV